MAETSPPSLIALHRLLLAITHPALTFAYGTWKERDRVRWYREDLPQEALRNYLKHWRERFWLFHPEQPFMQVGVLATAVETRDTLKPWTQISLASATGHNPVMFDHSNDAGPSAIPWPLALRSLLGILQCTPCCPIKKFQPKETGGRGPLADTAAVLPIGSTLNETLCSGLHPSPITDVDDIPAWEPLIQVSDLLAGPSLATGRMTAIPACLEQCFSARRMMAKFNGSILQKESHCKPTVILQKTSRIAVSQEAQS